MKQSARNSIVFLVLLCGYTVLSLVACGGTTFEAWSVKDGGTCADGGGGQGGQGDDCQGGQGGQ